MLLKYIYNIDRNQQAVRMDLYSDNIELIGLFVGISASPLSGIFRIYNS